MVPGWAASPSECGNGGNNLLLTGYAGIGSTVMLVNGSGHPEGPAEGQQSPFSRAEFMAGHNQDTHQERSGKPKPATTSLFEWAVTLERQREAEPVDCRSVKTRGRQSHWQR